MVGQTPPNGKFLAPEKVAYWYFRLNGFFLIENFVIHPPGAGSQRTDADLLAVRFPDRIERLFDDSTDTMADDLERLRLSPDLIDVVIAEIKGNQPCTFNEAWTGTDRQNVQRVLAATGVIASAAIEQAAADIYRSGAYVGTPKFRIRLAALGREHSSELATKFPNALQLVWPDILGFIWERFRAFRRQKTQVDQWESTGLEIKGLADSCKNKHEFTEQVMSQMGMNLR